MSWISTVNHQRPRLDRIVEVMSLRNPDKRVLGE